MSFSLKHIPCPAGKACTAFQCIFGHVQDKATDEVVPQQTQNRSRGRSPSGHGAPQKRIKTNPYNGPSPCQQISDVGNATAAASKMSDEVESTKSAVLTATRPVSPPPIRRNVKAASTKSSPATSRQKPSSTSKPARTHAVGSGESVGKPATDSAKARKPESLNPRLLKNSPATHETRLKLVKMLHAEYSRLNRELKSQEKTDEGTGLVLSDQHLIHKALDDEQTSALEKPAVYANVMKNKVMQYKRMKLAQWKDERLRESPRSTDAANGGGNAVEINTGLTSAQEVALLRRLITDVTGLSNHGYVSSVPSEEAVAAARSGLDAAKGWEKCDRCQQRFQVFPGRREEDGALTSGGTCNFHWGKAYVPAKAPGDTSRVPKRHLCCGQEVGETAGCFTHDKHVFKVGDPKRLAAVLNYAATPDNASVAEDRPVCFDCEMAYTVHGMELIRLTATAWPTGEELLDVLVQPIGEILDLNSRYSGVWPEDMATATDWTSLDKSPVPAKSRAGVTKHENSPAAKNLKKVSSPEVARDLLFSLLSPSTPLIGHGLENDLNAVRIVHPTLIDTVLLYPHKGGLPYRHSLKMLMDVHLRKKIQQETGPKVSGHDSAEDARAAGELVRFKVMNEWKDMQRAGWRVVDGEIWPPGKSEGRGKLTEAFIETKDASGD
ncbi:hypothetical protein EsDP_00006599 [Epichloe bromicola]|uniref:Exonuclease domain-containing protein n=1 Tax=Epichloe bromicola TaxID=79588 RepID=A0ABQ0CY41_9HYPO